MITVDEVLALRDAIPPRQPTGDPRNAARELPERRFGRAVRRYKKEHGISWFDAMKARDVPG